MRHPNHPSHHDFRADGVLRGLWCWTVFWIVVLVVYRGRLDQWEKPIQALLGGSLLAMGLWQFRRLTARGWWKGHWRATLRAQHPKEWTAFIVALNVILIGLVCLAVVSMGGFGGK